MSLRCFFFVFFFVHQYVRSYVGRLCSSGFSKSSLRVSIYSISLCHDVLFYVQEISYCLHSLSTSNESYNNDVGSSYAITIDSN